MIENSLPACPTPGVQVSKKPIASILFTMKINLPHMLWKQKVSVSTIFNWDSLLLVGVHDFPKLSQRKGQLAV